MTWTQHFFRLLNQAILSLDPEATLPLKKHEKKMICLEITPYPAFYFEIQANGLHYCPQTPEHTDVSIHGTPSAFMRMTLHKKSRHNELHIRGDMECAKALFDAWQQADLDWEGAMAKWIGDPMAHFFFQSAKATQSWINQTWENRQKDLGAYLQDEKKWLPTQWEVEQFFADIDGLRHDVERCITKVALLKQKIDKP